MPRSVRVDYEWLNSTGGTLNLSVLRVSATSNSDKKGNLPESKGQSLSLPYLAWRGRVGFAMGHHVPPGSPNLNSSSDRVASRGIGFWVGMHSMLDRKVAG